MAKRYDYVVLDIDGTLYSHRKYIEACRFAGRRLAEYAMREKIPRPFLSRLMKRVKAGKVTSSIVEICNRYNKDRMRFLNHVYDLDPGNFGIRKSTRLVGEISRLSKTSKIALFTNSPRIWASRVISELGISGLIDKERIITLDRLGKGKYFKPSRKAFMRLLRILHTKPERIIFLDDSRDNVDEARALGIHSILICNDGKCHIDGHSSCRTVYEELGALANSDK